MKIITANRLSDGRVIYLGQADMAVENLSLAALFDEQTAPAALERASSNPGVFVNPYTFEVQVPDSGDGEARLCHPSGRDRLKETIRSAGPSVGSSLPSRPSLSAEFI